MSILDISIVNIAIPSIQKELNLSTAVLPWLMTAYVLTYGGFLLVGGRLGDLFGRRKMLLVGLVCFTISSALGGVSTSAAVLIAARAGQGLGGAIITPTVMSFISGLFPEGEGRNRAMGLLGAFNGGAFALGLVLGGFLTTFAGWRWVFFINLPIGILVIALAMWLLPETDKEPQAINIPGAVLATLGMTLVVFSLSVSEPRQLLTARAFGPLIAGIGFIYVFVLLERRSSLPLIPPGLLSSAPLLSGITASTVFGLVVGPSTLILTIYLQDVAKFDALTTGLAYLPQEVVVLSVAYVAGRIVGRLDTQKVLLGALIAFGVGALCLTQLPEGGGYVRVVLPGFLLLGIGIGLVNVAGPIAATEGISSVRHGVSTGIWNIGMQIGTALGLAVLMSIASFKTEQLLASKPDIELATALVAGYRLAYVGGVGFAVIGGVGLYLINRLGRKISE